MFSRLSPYGPEGPPGGSAGGTCWNKMFNGGRSFLLPCHNLVRGFPTPKPYINGVVIPHEQRHRHAFVSGGCAKQPNQTNTASNLCAQYHHTAGTRLADLGSRQPGDKRENISTQNNTQTPTTQLPNPLSYHHTYTLTLHP